LQFPSSIGQLVSRSSVKYLYEQQQYYAPTIVINSVPSAFSKKQSNTHVSSQMVADSVSRLQVWQWQMPYHQSSISIFVQLGCSNRTMTRKACQQHAILLLLLLLLKYTD